MNIGDKVNLVVGFLNDFGHIQKENIHVFNDVCIIKQVNDFIFETEKIKVKPVNYTGYICPNGYMFSINSLEPTKLKYDLGPNCYIMYSKLVTGEQLQKNFINVYSIKLKDEIAEYEKKIESINSELNGLKGN